MGVEQLIRCDNPQCDSLGHPEFMRPRARKGHIQHDPPYGWIGVWITFMGSGPSVYVDACSVACLTPATEAKLENEQEETERAHAEWLEQKRQEKTATQATE